MALTKQVIITKIEGANVNTVITPKICNVSIKSFFSFFWSILTDSEGKLSEGVPPVCAFIGLIEPIKKKRLTYNILKYLFNLDLNNIRHN